MALGGGIDAEPPHGVRRGRTLRSGAPNYLATLSEIERQIAFE
jgi:hypothetical protein